MIKSNATSLLTIATMMYSLSAFSADQSFRIIPTTDVVEFTYTSMAENLPIILQSVKYVAESKEKENMILSDLASEKQAHFKNISQKSFDMAENYIKSLREPFLAVPYAFVRPSGHPAFYWGPGKKRHITLSVIDDDLLLSIVLPDEDIRIVKPSNVNNFNSLAQTVNDYLG